MKKRVVQDRRLTRLPELPLMHFRKKIGERRLHEKQNVGFHQALSPFCDGRLVTLLADRTLFLFLFF